MKLPLPEKIPVSEICRGMGLPSHAEPDEATLALAEKAAALVLESAQPRMIWRQLPLAWDGDSPRIAAELPLENGATLRLAAAPGEGGWRFTRWQLDAPWQPDTSLDVWDGL